ncbi:T9SS type A sorting domain-containing protein [Candidatus Marinimicrobia bacterium]|nr:T9SS type A sorting domain-containing protein [Candidatus Neomarinimicrobiota bacterium]
MNIIYKFVVLILIFHSLSLSQTELTWTPTVVNSYVNAHSDAVSQGDGNGIDMFFRNSGVVVKGNSYFSVNGVHPVNQGDYTSYYPKSIVKANLETDEIELLCNYYGSSSDVPSTINGVDVDHEIDMEGLTFGPDNGETYIYVGDEYNYIYQINLSDCSISKQWDLSNIGVSTSIDKGIEAITYSSETGYFYVGIQDDLEIHEIQLNDIENCSTASDCSITLINSFSTLNSPSGLFYDLTEDRLFVFAGTITNGEQYLYVYTTSGVLEYFITIPSSVGISRGDGIFIDSEYAYIADSQGPMWLDSGSLGKNLLKVNWSGLSSLSINGENHKNNKNTIPSSFSVYQNYPNPFNPITSLRYDLPKDGLVSITIYDMNGRIVKTLTNSSQRAGHKSVQWNATNDLAQSVSAGLYIYRIQVGAFSETKKMVLVK